MRLKAYECKKPWHPNPCWHTKCLECGEIVTAFDHDAEESLAIAREAHDCKCSSPEQLTLPARTG